ncbi:MAG: biotin/lipoyl-containing protein, partial [Thermoanaerobaculia bacterium]|nr:biotin/lipoyl-containing protein [Thermoanaerobaculia bacterium]
MAVDVIMPQMGESIAEGTITRWLVQEGEEVERDQPLFEISTDKVDAEIPSPESGVLVEIVAKEGDTVEVNEVVARIGKAGEAAEKKAEEPERKEREPAAEPEEKGAQEEPDEGEESAGEEPATAAEESADDDGADAGERERVRTHSSPVVRKMAAEADVDLSEVEGTGIH